MIHEDKELLVLFQKISLSSGPADMLLNDDERKVVVEKLKSDDWNLIRKLAFYVLGYCEELAQNKKDKI